MNRCRKYLFLGILPVISFYLMELYEHNPWVEVRGQAQFFNIILFEAFVWMLYLVTGRVRPALLTELVLSMVFGLVNHYVMLFRSTPFVPWDLYSVKTAYSVVGNYEFTWEPRVAWVTVGFLGLILLTAVYGEGKDRKIASFRKRLPFALILIGSLGLFVRNLQKEDFQVRHHLYPYLFTPAYMTQVNGMAVTFTINLQYLMVEKPAGYDPKECEEYLQNYASTSVADTQFPNLLVIMDEAFSDLSILGDFEVNEDYMPFMHSQQEKGNNTVTGMATVSVCGGNTANSEFEFLTANTMEYLPNGSIPYQQYIKKETPSLAWYLQSLGYETYAQHPYYATGWNRNQVYPWLGFSRVDFLEDYKKRHTLRGYVSDASDMQHIIDTFEQKESGKPIFLFNVTMQNHGGYTKEYPNFTNTIQADCDSEPLNQYLTLLKKTDESLEELIAYFSKVEEPTMIVFFGDHQPNDFLVRPIWNRNGVDDQNLSPEQQKLRYQVPYLIWANFELEEEQDKNLRLNELGALVLQKAGIPLDSYRRFMVEENIASMPYEQCSLFKKLQYYMLFDAKEFKR